MGWTITKSDGWTKYAETTAIKDTDDGATNTMDSSIVSARGANVLVKADEDATATVGISAKCYYTLSDGLNGAVGGVGVDPSSGNADQAVEWVEAEAEGDLADNELATITIPKRASRVKVTYTAAPDGGAISGHAGMGTEIWIDTPKSDAGFSISGAIGADPS